MSALVSPEIRVRWEVWRSFESCLRSYAAAAGQGGGEQPVVDAIGDHIDVVWRGAYLGFTMSPADGAVAWLIERPSGGNTWGTLEVLPEGKLLVGDRKQDLDHAAIDFLALLKSQIEWSHRMQQRSHRDEKVDESADREGGSLNQ